MVRSSGEALPFLAVAYRNTDYEAGGVVVRVGKRSAGMDRLLVRQRCRAATFVGAWNPYSRPMADEWNRRMQRLLCQAARRWPLVAGQGSWRHWREAHVLLFGDPRPAIRLARRFRQNAVVIVRRNQKARLTPIS